jgi:tetratricopeptide (TPR) repeat protein
LKPAELKATSNARNPQALQAGCVCVFLALAVLIVFGQTAHFGFVNCDDDVYVYDNAKVTGGLTLPGVAWSFTHVMCNFYHPLTMISLMLDYQLHQLNAGGYHLTNVLIHAASAVLLFLILRRMTGALWRSAFVAAVFAIHPLRVESVAWVAQRKDVLGAFFFMLTLGAYVRYARHPNSLGSYLMVAGFFVLHLLCKPTAVALPFGLLLLDYWPLHRFAPPMPTRATTPPMERPGCCFGIPRRLILEKIPLLGLAAAACVVTFFAERVAVTPIAHLALSSRIANVLVSYVVYLRQMVWPEGLAVFYPYPAGNPPVWQIGLAFLLLAGVCVGALALWRKCPWFMVGWFWYLGMLVPVIGFVPVCLSAHVDHYTYLPQIGLYVALTWAVADLSAGWRCRRLIQSGCAAAILAALISCAHIQTSFWRNSGSLWTHTISCTRANSLAQFELGAYLSAKGEWEEAIRNYENALEINPAYAEAHNNLGVALSAKGDLDQAILHYQQALEINPAYAEAHNNLGVALSAKGLLDEAILHYQQALETKPDYAEARNNLGLALFAKGDLEQAAAQYRKALETKPDYADAHNDLGVALLSQARVEEAVAQFHQALHLKPDYADAYANLGVALFQKRETKEAIESWQKALEVKPDQLNALNNLAWALATTPDASLRNGAKAVALAKQADQLSGGGNPMMLHTLAAAYAEEGSYGLAAVTARRGLALAAGQKNDPLAATLQKEIKLYEAGAPVREGPIQGSAPTVRDATR